MSRISAWYTCRYKWHAEHTNSNEGAKHENEEYKNLKYSAEEKEKIGLQCKYLINLGRLKYLEGLGLKCEMYNYVDSSVTFFLLFFFVNGYCSLKYYESTEKILLPLVRFFSFV